MNHNKLIALKSARGEDDRVPDQVRHLVLEHARAHALTHERIDTDAGAVYEKALSAIPAKSLRRYRGPFADQLRADVAEHQNLVVRLAKVIAGPEPAKKAKKKARGR